MKSLSVFLHGQEDIRLKEVEMPAIGPTQILAKVHASGICGSDVACYLGKSHEGRYDLGPYVPGHEWCGEVIEVGSEVTTLKVGDKVVAESVIACNHCGPCKEGLNNSYCENWLHCGFEPDGYGAMSEYIIGEEQFTYKVPDSMDYEEGALVECCSIPYYAIWGRGGSVSMADDVVVFGAGPIGLFAATICRAAGARVIVVDPVKFRTDMAENIIGVYATIDPIHQDVKEEILRITEGRGATLVIECTGVESCIALSLEVAAIQARVRFIGHSGDRTVSAKLENTILKGLDIRGSAGSPHFFPETVRFLSRVGERIDVKKLITHRFELKDAEDAFKVAVEQKDKAIKVLFKM